MSRTLRAGQLLPGLYDITASTAQYAITASVAQYAEFALNVSASAQNQIVSDNVVAEITTGTASFLLTSASIQLFQITDTGVAIFATQSAELTGPAPVGGMYFTSSSFFVGLE